MVRSKVKVHGRCVAMTLAHLSHEIHLDVCVKERSAPRWDKEADYKSQAAIKSELSKQ